MNKSFCLIILSFYSNFIFGQFTNLKFENLNTDKGLSSSTCLEVFQDSQGYLWFGTIDGLNKYNGYEFEIFRPILKDTTSISNNRINTIQEDKQGNLWIGTNNGLNFFNTNTKIFKHVILYNEPVKSLNPKKIINTLFYDKEENELWVGTSSGLVKLILNKNTSDLSNLKTKQYAFKFNNLNSLDNDNVNSIEKDEDGSIWVGTNGQHLNKYNANTDLFQRVLIKNKIPYEFNHIPKRLFIDSDNDFWIGNDASNIVLWNRGTNTFKHISVTKKSVPFYTLYQDSLGLVWIVTDGAGIFIYDKVNDIVRNIVNDPSDPFSLPGNQVSDVIEDKDGIFWLATYDEGICKLDITKSNFGHYYYKKGTENGLNEKKVQSVLQDSKGRIWIGAYNGGLNLFDEKDKTFKSFGHNPNNPKSLSSNRMMYTFEGADGDIWVCTLDGGLNKFNPESYTSQRFFHNESDDSTIGQNSVWTGVEDKKGRVWLGLRDEGLDLFDVKNNKFHHYKIGNSNTEGLLSNFVFSLFIDSKERLLVGTSLGLNYINLKDLRKEFPEEIKFNDVNIDGITGNRINYIEEDHLHNIWLGTDIGIYKLDSNLNLIKSYFTQDGLPNNLVTGIKEDLGHNFWITTRSGLSFLNPSSNQFKNFNTHDGIQGLEYQSKSIERTKDGRIIAGGINGFNIFNPNDIAITSSIKLHPKIAGLKINNKYIYVNDKINSNFTLDKPISEVENIVLNYDQSNLSFDFIALHYQNQEQVKYAYKMEGLNDQYIDAGSNRIVNYSSLPPGSYTFKVKASAVGDWDHAPESSVSITIKSPPWKTWSAYTVYFVISIVLLYYLQKYYTNRVKGEKEREFDQMKLEFFINVSHEFRTPLTLILNPLEKLMTGINDAEVVKTSATSIQRSARRLLYLVNQLLDYRKMEVGMAPLQLQKGDIVKFSDDIFALFKGVASKKGIDYVFTSATNELFSFFDFDKIEKILTNLISNAIKFTESGGEIKVSINKYTEKNKKLSFLTQDSRKLESYIEIVVEDTGIGLDKEQLKKIFSRFYNVDPNKTGTGIGLNYTKGLVEIHGGEIFVESQFGKGTKFVVRIPFNKTAESSVITTVKDEFLINSMKSVEYDMLISDATQDYDEKEDASNKGNLPKLLIVEDNKELRDHLKNELKGRYKIIEAVNGEDGLEKVLKYYPDIVVSDVMMPKMDGFELCKKVKSEFETCHIPVILLTARALEEDRVEGYNTGADGYLGKPFNMNVLKARIGNLLESKRIIREKFSKLGAVITPNEVTSNSIDEAFLEKTTKVILDNISDIDFKLEHLLKEIGIGRSQFYRKIQSITGQNPSNFIRTIRLKYASDLLLKGAYTIKEVTHMSGFNSAAYFGKTFRELYDMTPSEYVEHNKVDES
ncbi:two-component regulator propeller domain-containing protein [Mariniflexile sp. AS56]|uniref:hybrid sensor histidine kinase/response regulator transcription factor n=1 Tax=Mariniflexile sp. AS56 TaxID=3063957 RepID=UPI0026EDED1E|nr:two-component regulator propeller domain-containing protein [Mariniflexile sp. AS56]MDO7171565.1 two-component regulator propeller domain-containing protein [Mariniflexile sp. AS56]